MDTNEKQPWKEKPKVINLSDFQKCSVYRDLEKQGYDIAKDTAWVHRGDITLSQEKGWEIYYEENEEEHTRYYFVTEFDGLTLMIKPK
jgi:hypothetical protein